MSVPVPMYTGGGSGDQMFVRQTNPPTLGCASPSSVPLVMAWASFNPNLASARRARPTPSLFSAARRVTDWAMFLLSSSDWVFMFFLSFLGRPRKVAVHRVLIRHG